ncbi:MAG: rubredoxin [Atopobiaceae bacterium]|nr:rubredoxin [Atopobiaceae bacterium]MCI2174090.1 rubredoxin [Atopobiaceae bacterium]MCI2206731.1 rubredoxin [Atopobiaceae bacterium]
MVCGYVYETELTELPDDFTCPMCGVGKDKFEQVD